MPWFLGLITLATLALLAKRAGEGSDMVAYAPPANAEDWMGWVFPVAITDGRVPEITQGYRPGPRGAKHAHLGVDVMFRKRSGDPEGKVKHLASPFYIAPAATAILAAGPGKVWAVAQTGYGKSITIDHGKHLGGTVTFYQHLSEYARPWKRGDVVHAGDVLGTMGYTVDPILDPEQLRHLHFEIRFPVTPVNPVPYMRFWRKVTTPEAVA